MAFPSENSVASAPPVTYQGQIGVGAPRFCRPARAEGASVIAGIPVKRGTDQAVEVTPFAAADVNPTTQTFAGVVVLETSRPYDANAIEDGDPVAVMELGLVAMTFAAAVTAGQGVKIKHSNNTLEGLDVGDDPGAGYSALPGLRVAETRTTAGLAMVEVNLFGVGAILGEGTASLPIRVANIPVGPVARASIGTDAASTAGTVYFADMYVPEPMTVTGIGVLNGTVVGTDKVIVAIFDEAGTRLGTSALAGTLSASADAFQQIALTAPISIPRGRYWIAFQVEGTTAAHQTIAANTYLNSTGSVAGVWGTIPATITPTTTTTADVGPIGYLYT